MVLRRNVLSPCFVCSSVVMMGAGYASRSKFVDHAEPIVQKRAAIERRAAQLIGTLPTPAEALDHPPEAAVKGQLRILLGVAVCAHASVKPEAHARVRVGRSGRGRG